jgi:hypothetical protein
VQVSLFCPALHSFGYMPGSCISGSYGSSVFSFLRNVQIAFHNGCTNFHSYKGFLFHHILASICYCSCPWGWPFYTGVRWNLSVVLICSSFRVRKVEHFFMYLLAICTTSFLIHPAHCFLKLSLLYFPFSH